MKFRIGSINCLGASHTDGGGNKPGWRSSAARTLLISRVIAFRRFSVVGLQEFQGRQQRVFKGLTALWGMHAINDNAVIWLRARWRVVERGRITIPYFGGHDKDMPWVVLQSRIGKSKRIAFASTHNPANVRGEASHLRREGWGIEADWAKAMCARPDVTAAVVVGDKNAKEASYRIFIENRGGKIAGVPKIWGIDWIVGWGNIVFVQHNTVRTRRIRKATDHPVEIATARI